MQFSVVFRYNTKKDILKSVKNVFFCKIIRSVFFKLLHVRRRKRSIYWSPIALVLKDLCGEVCRY